MSFQVEALIENGASWGLKEIVASAIGERWIEGYGDVDKAIVDSVWKADEWVVTATGTSPITASVLPGAVALITSGGTDYDGDNIQIVGSRFKLEAGKPLYFGCAVTLNEATQSDLLIGLCGVDADLMASSGTHAIAVAAGGAFFSKVDNVTAGYFKTYSVAVEKNSAAAFTMDTNKHVYEIKWDGVELTGWFDGALVATFTTDIVATVLTPSVAFRTGSAAAKTCTLHWMRCIQARS